MLFGILKITIRVKKNDGMHRFGSVRSLVLICRVKQKPRRPVSRGEVEVVTVREVESGSRLRVVFVLLCKDRRWLLSRVEPAWCGSVYLHCASSWCFSVSVFVCVVVCLWFECFSPLPPIPTDRPWSRLTESSSPELRSVHLPTGGAGGAPLIVALLVLLG